MSSGTFARILKERQRRKRRRKLIIGGVAAGVLALAGFAVYALFFSPWLVATQVTATGQQLLSAEQVTTAAAVPLGEPLASLDLDAVEARVRELAPVAEVEVTREFPHELVIAVTEREAVYQRAADDGYEWVDATGMVFHATDQPDGDLLVAQVSAEDQRLLADVATVVYWIPVDVKPDVEGVSADAVDDIILDLDDDRQVLWGSADESELKSEVLGTLLQTEASIYDISAPLYPTTR